MKTRFAPSPTGWLHFGNVRTALFNYLYAKNSDGNFLLRVEDTDRARTKAEFLEGLYEDLEWLGLNCDEGPILQSQREQIYADFYQKLIEKGAAYPCFCTEEELKVTRKIQLAQGQPPRYPGTCRNLSQVDIENKIKAGIPATLRFRVPKDKTIEFVDLAKGPQKFASNDIGDFIIRRNDGSASFMFCNAVDDATMGVTHALRGDDHLTNTPRQIMILQVLDLPVPQYGHFAMINGSDGAPLSKRNGSESVRELRESGYHPLAVLNYLARLGHYYANNDFIPLAKLAAEFNLKHLNTAPARHDITHLRHWQKEAIMRCDIAELTGILAQYLEPIPSAKRIDFISIIKDNILMPVDAKIWVNAVTASSFELSEQSISFLKDAGDNFFSFAIDAIKENTELSFKQLADAVKAGTGRKGKELFMPLRIALTGQTHGPELAKLMEFMPSELILDRFNNVRTNYL